ncbi:MAG: DUF502 domain-containing protein [Planctomycetota bacterium]
MALRLRLVRYFLTGVFAVLPLVITVAAVAWLAQIVHAYIGPETTVGGFFSSIGLQVSQTGPGWIAYLVGWVTILGAVFLLGIFLEHGAKQWIGDMLGWIANAIPGIGSIYRTSKQVVGLMDQKESADLSGMSPVYCRFGGDPSTLILALLVSNKKFLVDGGEYYIVVVPTAPVPFGGALMYLPVQHVIPADMQVDALMSIYVSMGATAPEFLKTVD